MVPLKVSALSQEDQNYYHEQRNHYKTIDDAYTDWYACQHTLSQESNSTYFFVNHGKLILNSPWVLLRLNLMGSLTKLVHDNGGKFIGYAFDSLICVLGIKDVPTTSKNPQSNAICEHMHQTMATVLKTLLLYCTPQMPQDVLHLVDNGLATTMHLMRSTILTVLKTRPGALAFSWDMLLNVPLIAEWQTITRNRKALVNDANLKNNQWCINYDYYIGQHVLKYDNTIKGKLAVKTSGPFEIV